jgi:4-amino-4-deoxy-L-arabinose transferase-like glycosyltransferase
VGVSGSIGAEHRAAAMNGRARALAVGALLALFAWRELGAMRADGATVDEASHLAYGERGLAQGTFARDSDILNSKMPVSVLNALPLFLAARSGRALDWRQRLWLARLPTVLLGLALGVLVLLWAWELFGFGAGALALWLYTCCPNFLAHSHLVTTDVATALGMFGATYAFWRYRERPGGWRLAVAAAAFGAAQLTKVTALFLVPILVLIVLAEAVRRRLAGGRGEAAGTLAPPRRLPRALLPVAAFAAAGLLAVNLGFAGERTLLPLSRYAPVSRPFQALAAAPVVRAVPLPLPQPYLAGLDMVARDASAATPTYLHGHLSVHGFWDYFLVALLIKAPVGTLALICLAAWLAASGRLRAARAEAFLLVPVVFLLAYLSLAFALQIGFRYFLPALPFLLVFAARVAAWRPPGWWWAAGVGLLAAWTAVSSWSVHPHYIPYFNELVGGPRNGFYWLADSNVDWGQDDDYVREVYARRSPVKLWIEPNGPIAGRVAVRLTHLAFRYDWLRERFRPVELVHNSWGIFDLDERAIERCCAGLPGAWQVPDAAGDLALAGRPIGGGGDDQVGVRFLERLNDGLLGANTEWDAARSSPDARPVRAWFGIAWDRPQEVGRVVAYPGFFSRGPASRRFLATDYVLQWWDGSDWRDLPGTRQRGNRRLHAEHDFPPVRTTRLRLLIESELNRDGTSVTPGEFRAACLELVAYGPAATAPGPAGPPPGSRRRRAQRRS